MVPTPRVGESALERFLRFYVFESKRDRDIELERERERERNLLSKPQAVLRYGALSADRLRFRTIDLGAILDTCWAIVAPSGLLFPREPNSGHIWVS